MDISTDVTYSGSMDIKEALRRYLDARVAGADDASVIEYADALAAAVVREYL